MRQTTKDWGCLFQSLYEIQYYSALFGQSFGKSVILSVLGRERYPQGPTGWSRRHAGCLSAALRHALRSSPGCRRFAFHKNEPQSVNPWRCLTNYGIRADIQTQLVFLTRRTARQRVFFFPFNLILSLTHYKVSKHNFIISGQGGYK